eukprot:COSAG04_NODE_9993_length_814_cov_1.362238_2_plen_105_part_01
MLRPGVVVGEDQPVGAVGAEAFQLLAVEVLRAPVLVCPTAPGTQPQVRPDVIRSREADSIQLVDVIRSRETPPIGTTRRRLRDGCAQSRLWRNLLTSSTLAKAQS